jgi:hypothetical protein
MLDLLLSTWKNQQPKQQVRKNRFLPIFLRALHRLRDSPKAGIHGHFNPFS